MIVLTFGRRSDRAIRRRARPTSGAPARIAARWTTWYGASHERGASRRRRPGRHEDPGGRARARGRVVGQARRNTPRIGGPEAVAKDIALTVAEAAPRPGAVRELAASGSAHPGASTSRPDRSSRCRTSKAGTVRSPRPAVLSERLGLPVAIGNDVSVAVEAERRYGAGAASGRFSACSGGRASAAGSSSTAGSRSATGRPGRSATCASRRGGGSARAGCAAASSVRRALGAEQRARREARKRKTALFDIQRKRGRDGLTSGVSGCALDARTTLPATSSTRRSAPGVAIGSAVTLLDVELVVIGGGLGERLGPTWLQKIEKAAKHHTFFRPTLRYALAELGDMGGAIGAGLLGR